MRSSSWTAVVLAAVGLVGGCGPEAERSLESPPPIPRVDYAGCATVLHGPVCVVASSRRLRIWVEDVGMEPRIVVDGSEIAATEAQPVAGGLRFTVEVPASARSLILRHPRSGADLWSLTLAPPEDRPWVDRFRETARRGDLDGAAVLARERTRSPDLADRAVAHSWLRRLSFQVGDGEAFEDHARRAAELHAETGRLQDQVDEVTALVFQLLEDGRFAEARQELDILTPVAGESAEMVVRRAYFSGLWAEQVGDARTALASLSEAARTAERMGLGGEHRAALQVLARELQRVGRIDEAAAVFEGLGKLPMGDSCEGARLAVNEGWTWWRIREAGGEAPDPIPRYEEALTAYRDGSLACPRADDEMRNLELNLALAHVTQGRPLAARRALDRMGEVKGGASLPLELWRLDAEGRLALAEGRPGDALDPYRRLGDLARSAALPEARWRAAVGLARGLSLQGDRAAALAELTSAEALLDRETLRVPLGGGRGTFAGQHETASRWLVELLLQDGRPREALDAARRSRSRVLRGLRWQDRLAALDSRGRSRWSGFMERHARLRAELDAAAGDWALPADALEATERRRADLRRELTRTLDEALELLGDEPPRDLPPLRPDELTLAVHPTVRGWAVFGARGDRVRVHRVSELEPLVDRPAELAAVLLGPFAETLDDVGRLRVLPYGPLRGVDVHALPWRGGVVLDHVPVVYGLDLRVPELERTKMPALGGPFRILVVADPTGNLPQARRETDLVAAAFTGEDVRHFEGSSATAGTVRQELPEADLFHYAGHGRFRGLGGWESALLLADGGRLTLGDVLALPRAPRWVVLSGCETARTDDASPVETPGLAQAFAAAGSRGVVAAVRPVSDEAAAGLVEAFYATWKREALPTDALRTAQLHLRRSRPESDWAAFRLVTP